MKDKVTRGPTCRQRDLIHNLRWGCWGGQDWVCIHAGDHGGDAATYCPEPHGKDARCCLTQRIVAVGSSRGTNKGGVGEDKHYVGAPVHVRATWACCRHSRNGHCTTLISCNFWLPSNPNISYPLPPNLPFAQARLMPICSNKCACTPHYT